MSYDYNFRKEIRRNQNLNDLSDYLRTLPKGKNTAGTRKDVINELSRQAFKLAREEAKANPYEARIKFEDLKGKIDSLDKTRGVKSHSLFTLVFGPPRKRALDHLTRLVNKHDKQIEKLYSQLVKHSHRLLYMVHEDVYRKDPKKFLSNMEAQCQVTLRFHKKNKKYVLEAQKILGIISEMRELIAKRVSS